MTKTYTYCVVEPNGYPGDFDGEAYVTPPEDLAELIEASTSTEAKREYVRRNGGEIVGLRAHRVEPEERKRPLSLEWHEGYGPGTNIWFAYRSGDSGNCAAVDLKPGGWQYLIFDRNGTSWYVRRPGFYPTREEAMAAATAELKGAQA